MVHDAGRGGQDNVAELTGGQQLDNPLLELVEADVVARVDDTGLVEAAVELDNDLAGAVVVDLLELANVALRQINVSKRCRERLNIVHHRETLRTCKTLAVSSIGNLKD